MDLLIIDNVVKYFEQTKAVDHISLRVPEKTIFGLLGPNGAGKTTLIRMITEILYQDSGTIQLTNLPAGAERSLYIGYMPEERGLYKKMKVGEQLLYLAQLKNLSAKQAKEQLQYWSDKLGITDWWNKQVGELSKGMQQKVQFIATVIHQPRLIILDEPFSGLDPINTNLIKDEIYQLKENGATILFSTHRMEQVEEICERIALVNKGKLVLEGGVSELKNRFKENKFRLAYSGTLPNIGADAPFEILATGKRSITLHIKEGFTPNHTLQFCIENGLTVRAFNEILPSINEIFINQVQQENTAN
ncbi:MAG TPA: ATP-binding cassette domain-containing protein [Chitinophagales bacterium]|nr:ATP-binding cassette domain-containing protein [Chitinophagales bacterium]HRK27618.1 ATP-binding cassette domain-containing protein [Chitinophagales bacterium]